MSLEKKSKRRFFGAMTSSTNSTIDGNKGPSSEDEKPKKGKTFVTSFDG